MSNLTDQNDRTIAAMDRKDEYDNPLDWYDLFLTHTFPASDAIQLW